MLVFGYFSSAHSSSSSSSSDWSSSVSFIFTFLLLFLLLRLLLPLVFLLPLLLFLLLLLLLLLFILLLFLEVQIAVAVFFLAALVCFGFFWFLLRKSNHVAKTPTEQASIAFGAKPCPSSRMSSCEAKEHYVERAIDLLDLYVTVPPSAFLSNSTWSLCLQTIGWACLWILLQITSEPRLSFHRVTLCVFLYMEMSWWWYRVCLCHE